MTRSIDTDQRDASNQCIRDLDERLKTFEERRAELIRRCVEQIAILEKQIKEMADRDAAEPDPIARAIDVMQRSGIR